MGTVATALAISWCFAVLVGSPVAAAQMVLTCTTTDSRAYTFSVVIDPTNQAIVEIDGDGGWTTDRFSEAIIEAHFTSQGGHGTVRIDRFTGVIDTLTVFGRDKPIVITEHGTCRAAQKQF